MAEQTDEAEITQITPRDKMAQVDAWLDEYESSIGLPKYNENQISAEVSKYLSMGIAEFGKMTPTQCAEIAAFIVLSSFHIQRSYNREVSHVTWADDILRLGVAGKTENYRGSFMQQENQAIKEDDYLFKVSRIKTHAKQRSERLAFLSNTLHKFADKLENLQIEKNKKA